METGYIQLSRGSKTLDLIREHPECFLVLTQIAIRARRTSETTTLDSLEPGQALIGDWKSIGLSSEKVYRNAKKKLEKLGISSFKGTSKGTVATILQSDIYNINMKGKGEQRANGGRARGEQGATNKNGNNDKKENNLFIDIPAEFIPRWYAFQNIFEERFPTVGKITNQLTPKELYTLSENYHPNEITEVLERMENYKNITKYTSVYLTLNNWLKKQAA